MTGARVVDWLKLHRWWLALVIVIVAGYSVGKDLALRDDARDSQVQARGA